MRSNALDVFVQHSLEFDEDHRQLILVVSGPQSPTQPSDCVLGSTHRRLLRQATQWRLNSLVKRLRSCLYCRLCRESYGLPLPSLFPVFSQSSLPVISLTHSLISLLSRYHASITKVTQRARRALSRRPRGSSPHRKEQTTAVLWHKLWAMATISEEHALKSGHEGMKPHVDKRPGRSNNPDRSRALLSESIEANGRRTVMSGRRSPLGWSSSGGN